MQRWVRELGRSIACVQEGGGGGGACVGSWCGCEQWGLKGGTCGKSQTESKGRVKAAATPALSGCHPGSCHVHNVCPAVGVAVDGCHSVDIEGGGADGDLLGTEHKGPRPCPVPSVQRPDAYGVGWGLSMEERGKHPHCAFSVGISAPWLHLLRVCTEPWNAHAPPAFTNTDSRPTLSAEDATSRSTRPSWLA